MKRADSLVKVARMVGARSIAEIGVLAGDLSREVLKQMLPDELDKYVMVDDWSNPDDHLNHRWQAVELSQSEPRVTLIETRSLDAAAMFEDHSIDLVYIDADHSLVAVESDLAAWWPKARLAIGGHDYVLWNTCCDNPVGVVPAVEAFADHKFLSVLIDGERRNRAERLRISHDATPHNENGGDEFPSWFIIKEGC